MSASLGIAVGHDAIHAVFVHRGHAAWQASRERRVGESATETMIELLAAFPTSARARVRATVALGLATSQLRRLDGFPTTKDVVTATRLVRENAASFFLRMPGGFAIAPVERRADGSAWAAAFDQSIASDLLRALRALGVPNTRVVPGVVALAAVLAPGTHVVADGECVVEFTTTGARAIDHVRRVREMGATAVNLAADAARGAALMPARQCFVWRPEPPAAAIARRARWRVAAAGALFAAGATLALVAPGLRAIRTIRDAARQSRALAQTGSEAKRMRAELDRTTTMLQRAADFDARRGRATLLLGELAQVLPESTALVSFHVDSAEGTFTALTPHVADVLPQLASVSDIVAPRVVGSITREATGPVQLERATIRFRRNASTQTTKSKAAASGHSMSGGT